MYTCARPIYIFTSDEDPATKILSDEDGIIVFGAQEVDLPTLLLGFSYSIGLVSVLPVRQRR